MKLINTCRGDYIILFLGLLCLQVITGIVCLNNTIYCIDTGENKIREKPIWQTSTQTALELQSGQLNEVFNYLISSCVLKFPSICLDLKI